VDVTTVTVRSGRMALSFLRMVLRCSQAQSNEEVDP
jgi:hypothetical protein